MREQIKKKKVLRECPADILSLSHDGRGMAIIDNKKAFIQGALPQEHVTCQLTYQHANYLEAKTLHIHQPSSQRVTPPCPHFDLCGGCSLQHMSMEMQLALKERTLLEQLKHFGKVEPLTLLSPLHVNSAGYRRKARLGVKFVHKKGKVIVGFREKSSHYLADLTECLVLHASVGKQFPALQELITSLSVYQHIPQIEIAVGEEETALVFRHLQPLLQEDYEKLVTFGQTYGFHIYLQPNAPALVEKIWPTDYHDRLSYSLVDFNLTFLFHPLDFTQINHEMNAQMVKQALFLLELHPADKVLDLYCGIGNFSLPMAQYAQLVTGIEGSKEMVVRAQQNAMHNRIRNVNFFAANLEHPASDTLWMKNRYDKILLDPPRTGAKEIIPFFSSWAATRIVYVSCNPATLARDAGLLVNLGYQLSKVGVINMFAHTSHVEAMAVFDKTK
jgi:23S rRNA (uracil1939-C5)-methyltransferase